MRFRGTLVLLALVLGLGGYAWIAAKPKPDPRELPPVLPGLAPAAVERLEIAGASATVACRRAPGGEGWTMTSPVAWKAAGHVLDEILKELAELRPAKVLSGTRPDAGHGLDPAQAVLRIWTPGAAAPRELKVGSDSADGKHAYAAPEGAKDLVLLPKTFTDRLRKAPNEFRDRSLGGVRKEKVERFELRYPDRTLAAARKDGVWRVASPVEALAGAGEVEAAVGAFLTSPVEEWIADGVTDFAPYGLDAPRLEARFWEASDTEPRGFAVGKVSKPRGPFERYDTYYARFVGTGTVATFKIARPDDYVKEVRQLRPRRLLSDGWENVRRMTLEGPAGTVALEREGSQGWKATAPFPGPMDPRRVDELLAQPLRQLEVLEMEPATPERQAALGLAAPRARLRLEFQSGLGQEIRVGAPDPVTGQTWVKPEDEGLAFAVGAPLEGILKLVWSDLRERQVLSLRIADLRELTVDAGGTLRVFESRGKGAWAQVKPGPLEGRLAGTEALVTMLASLTADRFAGAGDGVDWAARGLEPPAATLKLLVDDGAGGASVREIRLGHREGDLVYGRRGDDPELLLLPGRLLDFALGDPTKGP